MVYGSVWFMALYSYGRSDETTGRTLEWRAEEADGGMCHVVVDDHPLRRSDNRF